jgi:hypothetical protein
MSVDLRSEPTTGAAFSAGDVVRLLAPHRRPNDPRVFSKGIVVRAEEGQPLVLYPMDERGSLPLSAAGAPESVALDASEVALLRQERRQFVRRSGLCAVYLEDGGIGPYTAEIVDVSEAGVGVLFEREIPAGTTLRLGLLSRKRSAGLLVGATVRGAAPQNDHCWRIGCELDRRLTPEELAALVQ